MSARFAGFDLPDGRSLVMASSLPPAAFYHAPDRQAFGYRCAGTTRFAFYPGYGRRCSFPKQGGRTS